MSGTAGVQERPSTPSETSAPPDPVEPVAGGRTREALYDNAKFVAILLVVGGHAIEALAIDHRVGFARGIYVFLYMFHMPVFIVIAGYFAKGFPSSSDKVRKLVTRLLVPFLVFQMAYLAFARLGGKDPDPDLLDPYYLTWFLLALFAWRISAPVWLAVRLPVLVAVAISVLAGTQHLVGQFEMGRVLSLLPFFVLGLWLKPEYVAFLRRRIVRLAAVPVMAAGLGVAFLAYPHMHLEWIFWRRSNDWFHVDDLTGSAMRLAMLVCATVLVAAFLALVPGRTYWFSRLGQRTLYVYLLHGFVIKGAIYLGLYDLGWLIGRRGVVLCFAAGLGLALLLSTGPVVRLARPLVEPRMAWAFRRRTAS